MSIRQFAVAAAVSASFATGFLPARHARAQEDSSDILHPANPNSPNNPFKMMRTMQAGNHHADDANSRSDSRAPAIQAPPEPADSFPLFALKALGASVALAGGIALSFAAGKSHSRRKLTDMKDEDLLQRFSHAVCFDPHYYHQETKVYSAEVERRLLMEGGQAHPGLLPLGQAIAGIDFNLQDNSYAIKKAVDPLLRPVYEQTFATPLQSAMKGGSNPPARRG